MKKILIFSHAMELGGVERALLGLLETIDTTEYQVDLFLMRHRGELMKYIPGNIHLLPEIPQYACLAVPIVDVIKKKQFQVAFARLNGKKAAKKQVKNFGLGESDIALEYSHKYTCCVMPMISDTEYDLAISFLTPHYFVTEKVKAKKKIAWIHTDYTMVQVDKGSQLKMWDRYDKIVSISEQVTESFLKVFPELKEKIELIQNIMPVTYVRELVDEYTVEKEMPDDETIKLLSVGRFCNAKNFDNVPDICRRIRERGCNVKWYLIGYGGDEELIKEKIIDSQMEEYVILLGKKENPYPYIKACDIYVQPSRYEGKCVSVIEAQILHKPVIITNYTTSGSQLKDGYDGIIVPMDNEGCAEGIVSAIQDRNLQYNLIRNTMEKDYANTEEIQKIYSLIKDKKEVPG